MNYDIIGDIHGHAAALRALLASLGYSENQGAWRHPERQALFVGDFIDRGPQQVETVDIVRRMTDAGSAQAVMGNHEFNAIAWYIPDLKHSGEYLRPHHSAKYGKKNFSQHQAFLAEVNGTPRHKEIIDWFLTLPLWLDIDVRVVHACWHQRFMNYLKPKLAPGNRLTPKLIVDASREPTDDGEKDTADATDFKAVEALTKGIEIPLPSGKTFKDEDDHERSRVRSRWWDRDATTYPDAALLDRDTCSTLPVDSIPDHAILNYSSEKPTFFGHYWLNGTPTILSDKMACVDYSIAKGGKLVAYRWDGEPALDDSRFHWIGQ